MPGHGQSGGAPKRLQASDAVYAGARHWKGTEFAGMVGADGSTALYYSGPCYFVSAALARAIFQTDRTHTLLFDSYGSNAEDANMGKWVEHSQATHSDLCYRSAVP